MTVGNETLTQPGNDDDEDVDDDMDEDDNVDKVENYVIAGNTILTRWWPPKNLALSLLDNNKKTILCWRHCALPG